ncbi:hypothetical protein ABT288_27700 [Streptomyces sp. NPDC001093]|uniref:hypothetical protein n=1 Tax=Streptomyces sp. NPDC001093 TaxID=3154376 RepID=UPI00331C5EFF
MCGSHLLPRLRLGAAHLLQFPLLVDGGLNFGAAERLADTPTPAGPTPRDLGTTVAFVPPTQLMSTLPAQKPGQRDKQDIDRKPPGYQE